MIHYNVVGMNIALCLEWHGETHNSEVYHYDPPVGGFVANDETEYDAITWNDPIFTKPL